MPGLSTLNSHISSEAIEEKAYGDKVTVFPIPLINKNIQPAVNISIKDAPKTQKGTDPVYDKIGQMAGSVKNTLTMHVTEFFWYWTAEQVKRIKDFTANKYDLIIEIVEQSKEDLKKQGQTDEDIVIIEEAVQDIGLDLGMRVAAEYALECASLIEKALNDPEVQQKKALYKEKIGIH